MSDIISNKEKRSAFYEKLHNLLWNEAGFDPAKALEHLTFFFAYRMIEAQADVLGLPNVCRWSYVVNLSDEHTVDSAVKEGITRFIADPRTKPFFKRHEIKKADVVYRIMKEINAFMPDIGALHETDTLGDIFEYMIGRGMSTMSDEGQYFTDRKICRLGFKLCYDIKNTIYRSDGSLCTFADWFCGTGGFVTEYVRSVSEIAKKAGAPIDWSVSKNSVYAIDKSESAAKTTLLNQLISTGHMFNANQICEHNSFQDQLVLGPSAPFKDVKMDYLLLNPPYGGDKTKGKDFKFKYTKETVVGGKKTKVPNVNAEIQSIGIEDDDKVSAGVQLAMATLAADGGVCAIVLPQGFFFGSTNKCVELRKKIAEEYKIHCVVDIASGAFANTGTKTSMMVFQRGVGSTETVKFIDMDEKVLVEATLADLRGKKYSLNFKQYLAQDTAEIEGFEMVKLGDICEFHFGERITKKEHSGFLYPVYGGGNDTFRTDKKNREGITCKVSRFGMSEHNCVQIINGDYWLMDSGFTISAKKDKAVDSYVWNWLVSNKKQVFACGRATAQMNIDIETFKAIQIPLPSLERQAEIVRAIDTWADFAHREEELLKILEQQVMFEVRELGRGKPRVKLGEVCEFQRGKMITKKDLQEGPFPVIGGGLSPMGHHSLSNREAYSVLISQSGENAGHVSRYTKPVWASDCFSVSSSKISNDYLYFALRNIQDDINFLKTGTAQPHIYPSSIEGLCIYDPSIEEQHALQSDFDEIRHKHAKIAEYKAKAQAAIQRLIPGTHSAEVGSCSVESKTDGALAPVAPLTNSVSLTADVSPIPIKTSDAEPGVLTLVPPSSPITETTNLEKKTKAELQAIARDAKIKGFSTKNKDELIALIKSTNPRE